MMDKQTTLSYAQAIVGGAGTYVCTDKIHANAGKALGVDTLGNTLSNDMGKSPKVDIMIIITEAFVGADTVQFQLGYDDDAAFATPTILATTEAIAVALLKPGYQVRLTGSIPAGQATADVHLGTQYKTLGATANSAGKITAAVIEHGGVPTAPGVFL